jgi:hypothetical protein
LEGTERMDATQTGTGHESDIVRDDTAPSERPQAIQVTHLV